MPFSVRRHWDSVNIRGTDGLMYHGRVVDCVEEGLVVNDLGCETVPQLVPFGQMYRCLPQFNPYPPEGITRMPVEALMRLQLTEPARWYPGIFLAGELDCRQSFGVVLVTTPTGTSMEVLPANRILQLPTAEEPVVWRLVAKGEFAKEQVTLPSGVCSGSPSPGPYRTAAVDQHLVDCFNLNNFWRHMPAAELAGQMVATHIDGPDLHVLMYVRHPFNCARTNRDKLEGDTFLRMLGVEHPGCFGVKRKRLDETDGETNVMATVDMLSTMEPLPLNNYLPQEVLAELFTFLNGVEQARLRRVCPKWNDILTALPVTRILCVGVPIFTAESCVAASLVRVDSLGKQWTGRTKIIINTNYTTAQHAGTTVMGRQPLMCSGRLFRAIMQERQLSPLEVVMLVNIRWNWQKKSFGQSCYFSYFVQHICEELSSFASVCHRLEMKNITVEAVERWKHRKTAPGNHNSLGSAFKTAVIVHISRGRVTGELRVEAMWSMMEDSLPRLSSTDLNLWRELVQTADNDTIGELLEILMECQSADPRASNQFRNKQWTVEDLPVLAPEKLNRITQHNVLKVSSNEQLVLSLSW